jgi:uncharacterized RDD family membrane protein YckC
MGVPDPIRDSQFYVGVPTRRFVAFCIDLLIILGLWCVVLAIGLLLTVVTFGIGTPLAIFVLSVTGFLYRWIMLVQRSATIGMMLTGIEVRDASGRPVNELVAFLHVGGFYISLFVTPLLVIGWLLMATSPRRQLLHDLVLGAVVINRPV